MTASRKLDQLSSGRALLALTALIILINAGIAVFPPAFHALDIQFHYSPEAALALLDTLGPAGRHEYFVRELVDLVFMASYSLLLAGLLRRTYRQTEAPMPAAAALLSWLPGALDLIETAGILVLLGTYPDQSSGLAGLVSVATPLKWLSFIPWAGLYVFRLIQTRGRSHA